MFVIDKHSRTPIYEQLIDQFESCIMSGDIAPDGKLPSVRYLSIQLNINPNTLQRAFTEIERRGLCYTVPGSGRYISGDALDRLRFSASKQTDTFQKSVEVLKNLGIPKQTLSNIIDTIYDRNERSENQA